ncbi:DUF6285 domain-containing protein [OCS116 cluster bacterium]|nr:DUF6285 domain-containing protein [OCS116 cluster bacterium]
MRSEPTIKELITSITSFLEDLNFEDFPNTKNHIDTLKNINQINESKINEIIEFINDDLISHLTDHNRFYAFVARNSLQIIKREINLINSYEEKEVIRLEKLLNEKGNIKDLNKVLCKRISDKELDRDNNELKDHLVITTMAKLSIDQPNYSGYLKGIKDGYSKD